MPRCQGELCIQANAHLSKNARNSVHYFNQVPKEGDLCRRCYAHELAHEANIKLSPTFFQSLSHAPIQF